METGKLNSGALLVRAALTAVFGAAGVIKIADPAGFVADLESYRMFPPALAVAIASYLPWLEVFAGVALWVPRVRGGARLILLGLTVGFLIVLGIAWARGIDIRCGCFGSTRAATGAVYVELVLRDLLIFGGLVFLTVSERRTTGERVRTGAAERG